MSRKGKSLHRRVSPKNQVAIPVYLMKKFDIAPRSTVTFEETEDGILIQAAEDPIQKLKGIFKGQSGKSALEIKRELREEELDSEKRKFGHSSQGSV